MLTPIISNNFVIGALYLQKKIEKNILSGNTSIARELPKISLLEIHQQLRIFNWGSKGFLAKIFAEASGRGRI